MQLEHASKTPKIHPSAYVAPNAVVCGDVTIGPDCRVMFGAQLIAEGGSIVLGKECIVLENAVLRSTAQHSLKVGNNCLIGPHAHLVGCAIDDEVFVATGASVFHAARVGKGAEVRINAIVHLRTEVGENQTVPIGWVAVGSPAQMFAPHEHEKIWELQRPLNFPLTAYGLERSEVSMVKITQVMVERLGEHRSDATVDEDG
jgi:carbonic anhydrase/acetyltransferase-like protein (isoleucine patch superfamily)